MPKSAKSPLAGNANKQTSTRSALPKIKTMSIKKWHVLIVLVIVFLILLGYRYRSALFVATVNGQPLSRISYYLELEKQGGKTALDAIVTKTLILQEAAKRKVSVSDEEITGEVKKIEDNLSKQGQNLDQVLDLRGLTRQDLNEQIRLQKLIEKMAVVNISVSEKEIDEFLSSNQDAFSQTEQDNEVRNSVKEQIRQQKTSEAIQKFIENLQKNAKINYFI